MAWLAGAAPREKRGQMIGSAMAAAIAGALLGPVIGVAADLADPGAAPDQPSTSKVFGQGRRPRRSPGRAARPRSRRPSPSRSSARASRAAPPRRARRSPPGDAAPPTPWTNRARSSTRIEAANATATLDSTMSASPNSTVGLTPTRAASMPPGSPPTNVPTGYAAARMPAPVLDSPNSFSEIGQERCDRRVERRVHQHHGGDEEQELAHGTSPILGPVTAPQEAANPTSEGSIPGPEAYPHDR